jgi:CheY-like chemotaxis protein/HPt (histidine-containing phosphotransfer) domain-containing protein
MNGVISLESEPGQGSLFWFELPFELGDADMAAQQSTFEPALTRPLRVLVVDDVAVNRELLSVMLGQQSHEVLLAADGLAALEIAAKERLDVVLMDIQMPVMDGIEATRRIRLLPAPLSAVPIMALTANVMVSERQRFLAAGMDLCLTKPVVWPELFAALANVAAGRARLVDARRQEITTVPTAHIAEQEEPLLNRSMMNQMRSAMPPAAYQKMLARGLEGASESRRLIEMALDDRDELIREAHRLRGTAGTFGLTRISALAGLIEDRASRGEDVTDLTVELGRVLELTRATIQQFELVP